MMNNEATAHHERAKLQAILAAAVDFAVITLDLHGIIIDWSPGAEAMFGYSAHEVIGRHTEILFTPEDREGGIPMVEINTAKTTGRSLDERWHLCRDGSRFFMSGVMTPLTAGPLQGYVKVTRNITERKLAEEALWISEQRKSLAVQSAGMGEWEWNAEVGTVHLNEAAAVLIGQPGGDQHMNPESLLDVIYPPDRPSLTQSIRQAIEGLAILQGECRIIRQGTKESKWAHIYGRIIKREGGKPSRVIGVVYDITPRKVLEKQKEDFIGVASHELKTPVTAIAAYIEILEEQLEKSGATEYVSLLRKIRIQVHRLIKLVQTLLDVSSLEEGRIPLHPNSFDLNQLIGEQIDAYQQLAGNRIIRWLPAPLATIHADPDRIMQVMANLVSNAIKYSPEDTQITLSTEDRQDSVIVRVHDQGPGIALEAQPFLFDRYYRVPGGEKQEGFGLGLFICASIIRQHMGNIGVECVPGEGSTFYFTLPYS